MYSSTDHEQKQRDSTDAKRFVCAQFKDVAAWRYRTDFNWDVRPAFDQAKYPNVKWSKKNAPAPYSPDEIALRWCEEPWLNIILLTGKRSGIMVGDIDPRHGGSLDTLWRMGWPQETVIAISGSGGWHVYAQCPSEGLRSVPNYAQGIELKADGAVIVAPPSRHPNGNLYQWLDGHDPWTLAPAPLPGHVLADIPTRDQQCDERLAVGALAEVEALDIGWSRKQVAARARRFYRTALWKVRNQGEGRNNTMFWLAGQLYALGFSGIEVRLWAEAFAKEVGGGA